MTTHSVAPFSPLPTTRRTKIVATIGPATESTEQIRSLIEAGMDIARFNTKHNEPAWHHDVMKKVRDVAAEMGKDIPILLDLQGPEIRITLVNQNDFLVKKGETALFTANEKHPDPKAIFVPAEVTTHLEIGKTILLEDGICELVVVKKDGEDVECEAVRDSHIHTRKTLNMPGIILDMPSLQERDIAFIDATVDINVEYVGLSYVRTTGDIDFLRAELKQRNLSPKIIAKIENAQAIENLDSLIEASDAVMVARGDLAMELPFYEVPHWQKVIIEKSRAQNKFVITATQMLLSMIERPMPTRAEINDVAAAVYDRSDAVMLSEETTMGKFPVEAVEVQAKILAYHEQFV